MVHNGAKVVIPEDDAIWLTHGEAAALTGLQLTMIEWWASSKKIETRSRDLGPTIKRDSLLAYVVDWKAAKSKPRPPRYPRQPRPPVEPPSREWIGVPEAAELLDRKPESVSRIARQAGIAMQRSNGRLWLRRTEMEALAGERAEWVSWVDARDLTGLSISVIARAARDGLIEQRPGGQRWKPGLRRKSVEKWAAKERKRRAAAEARRASEEERREPPRDGRQWMSVSSAARVLALGPSRVRQLVDAERLPAARKEGRIWLRLEHVEAFHEARLAQTARKAG